MRSSDTRCLSPDAQEALRFRVVRAIREGMKKAAAARAFGVSRTSIDRWLTQVALGNINSLRSKPRGRPKGTRLAPHQAATTENVRRLAIDLDRAFGESLSREANISIDLDGTKLGPIVIESLPARRLLLGFEEGNWQMVQSEPLAEKGPHRAGPFKEAFRNRVLLVMGTLGTKEENAWALSKAC